MKGVGQKRRQQSGFTLIEVLVGLLVLGLAAGATAMTMQSTANYLSENRQAVAAIALAQGVMEEVRAQPFDEIESGSKPANAEGVSVFWLVAADTPEKGMKRVSVKASWFWKGVPRKYELQTVYSRITRR